MGVDTDHAELQEMRERRAAGMRGRRASDNQSPHQSALNFLFDKLLAPSLAAIVGGMSSYVAIREDLRELQVRVAIVERQAALSEQKLYDLRNSRP